MEANRRFVMLIKSIENFNNIKALTEFRGLSSKEILSILGNRNNLSSDEFLLKHCLIWQNEVMSGKRNDFNDKEFVAINKKVNIYLSKALNR